MLYIYPMIFFYNIAAQMTSILLPFCSLFSKKIKLFVAGRTNTFNEIAAFQSKGKTVWFHVASLGEFEQARPLIERCKKEYPNDTIALTFFSPSGYEIQKNYQHADLICYLPLDTKKNAQQFIALLNPAIAIFIKYEFWPHYLNELHKTNTKTLLVAGIFRKNQLFFQFYGGFMRKSLQAFHHFFVQDTHSEALLKKINISNTTVAGDTRFDRVAEILNQNNLLDFITNFKDNHYTVVAGSTWKEGEAFLKTYINNEATNDEKFIIAPHQINTAAIKELQTSIVKKSVLYSEKEGKNLAEYQVFIIDTVGLLTKIYAEADVAYVGGGLKTGLHNILEPATFGIPVVIGSRYKKHKEAVDLTTLKGCLSIKNQKEFSFVLKQLKEDFSFRKKTGIINKKYVESHLGATQTVFDYLRKSI